ncbi:MAG TPA: MarR family transcriptional regulator, partial [Chloroflexota bacterium]|nr:MarR family transcriptional regulator [Chloroflexota bacterium]
MNERDGIIADIIDTTYQFMRSVRGRPSEWIDDNITIAQLKTLLVLYERGHVSMGELATSLNTGVSTVTGIVDRLVDHGLVVRDEDRHDRRVVVGRLTAAGSELAEKLYVSQRDRMRLVLEQMTIEDLQLVIQASKVLCDAALRTYPMVVG